jgi:hypothetical protein
MEKNESVHAFKETMQWIQEAKAAEFLGMFRLLALQLDVQLKSSVDVDFVCSGKNNFKLQRTKGTLKTALFYQFFI